VVNFIEANFIAIAGSLVALYLLVRDWLKTSTNRNVNEDAALEELRKMSEERRSENARLRDNIATLEKEVMLCSRENERLREKISDGVIRDLQHEYLKEQYYKLLRQFDANKRERYIPSSDGVKDL
jgi:uncharacterized membrane protein YheB (UPF0754 family)